MKDTPYVPSADEASKIKEILSYYNEQLKAWFLKDVPNLRTEW